MPAPARNPDEVKMYSNHSRRALKVVVAYLFDFSWHNGSAAFQARALVHKKSVNHGLIDSESYTA